MIQKVLIEKYIAKIFMQSNMNFYQLIKQITGLVQRFQQSNIFFKYFVAGAVLFDNLNEDSKNVQI